MRSWASVPHSRARPKSQEADSDADFSTRAALDHSALMEAMKRINPRWCKGAVAVIVFPPETSDLKQMITC